MADPAARPGTMPVQRRDASFVPASFDEAKRTMEVVWSKGAPVQRTDWWNGKRYTETLSLDAAHVDLSRMNAGAPVLLDHRVYEADAIIGVVEKAWIADGEGRAIVRFSEVPEVQRYVTQIREGVLRNISITYQVRKFEITEEEGKDPVYRAVDWMPWEVSFLPVGADPDAGSRGAKPQEFPVEIVTRGQPARHIQEQANMSDPKNTAGQPGPAEQTRAAVPPPASPDENAIRTAAIEAERKRAADIRTRVRSVGLGEEFADDLVSRNIEAPAAAQMIVDELAKRAAPAAKPHNVSVGYSPEDPDVSRAVAGEALLARATRNLQGDQRVAPTDRSRELAGLPLLEVLAEHARVCGVKIARGLRGAPLYDALMEQRTLATGDFPLILSAASNKIMVKAYMLAEPTYRRIAARRSFADFKPHNFLRFGDFPAPAQKNEAGEFTYGAISEARNQISAEEFGRIVRLTRRMLVNDDMDAFSQLPAMAARRSADFENRKFFEMFALNAGAGPTIFEKNMPSGRPLFHAADHGNYVSSGTVIDVTNVGLGRAAMMKQKSLDGLLLNTVPRFLLTSPDKYTIAEQFCAVNIVPATDANANPFKGKLEPLADASLTGNAWHLFADPSESEVFVYGYLDGFEGPRLLTKEGFTTAGMDMLLAIDWACGAVDYRGAYKNAGA